MYKRQIPDTPAQRARDRGRVLRAFNLSLATVLVLTVVFFAQSGFDFRAFTVMPHDPAGLVGVLTAPLLNGDLKNLAMNCIAILTVSYTHLDVYKRQFACSLIARSSGEAAMRIASASPRSCASSRRS